MISNLSRPDLKTALHPDDPCIKSEILSMIVQYLEDSKYYASALNLRDEIRFQCAQNTHRGKQLAKLRGSITSGDWTAIENLTADLCANPQLLYTILRHRFYELLLQGDTTTALQFLSTRLREYRSHEDVPGDFDRLCLLVVEAASPSQIPQLPDLEESIRQIINAIDQELGKCDTPFIEKSPPPHRLIELIKQAVTFQYGTFPPDKPIQTLISDFEPPVIPTGKAIALPTVHSLAVKSLAFVPGSNLLLSGSNDKTVCLWSAATKKCVGRLNGHNGRVWSIAASEKHAVTSSSDSTVKLWSLHEQKEKATFRGHTGDVYCVDIENGDRHIVSGGYDQSIVVWDSPTEVAETILKGHSGAVTAVQFDNTGKLVVSGGADLTVQLWDVRSYLATIQLAPVLSEVTSLSADKSFTHILAATKDSTNRIWDLRKTDSVVLLKGHSNASKHFVRARYGPDDKTVIGGSDDGKIYCWDAESGKVVDKMRAHPMGVFDVVWSSHAHMFASCGNDNNVLLWEPKPV
ncbi:WD repeat protein [Tritrichomonas foetus]|uniref:WD40 repeat-containing protein SMU1 n=1 Tax=Tritrichomonas foetus TaxID=1144522 RepID=A0A1J4KTL9_9EUKA|nr:WD repeat protein [Tritrichomonas foetus]OHT14507.1 WD repeat protein [Tritrichomonas foetus]|eukprot:OHT14240.1 WD repeat protein [Tritrichomonas foetus]